MRIPPEYLAEVIARREGRDPASVTIDNPDEDEDEGEEWAKYAPRKLVQQDAQEEPETGILIVNEEEIAKAEGMDHLSGLSVDSLSPQTSGNPSWRFSVS
jgi:hypothetical protein